MKSKTEKVKSLFEVPERYLGPRHYDIRIRAETVQELTSTLMFDRALDIGCGDGSISSASVTALQQAYSSGSFQENA